MKYSKMVCWVRPHEKKELINAINGKFPVAFAKNYADFTTMITNNSYLVVSLSKAKFGFRKLHNLITSHKDNIFHFYQVKENETLNDFQFAIMDEKNAIDGQYGAQELVDNYLGVIPDLWQKRKQEPIALTAEQIDTAIQKLSK